MLQVTNRNPEIPNWIQNKIDSAQRTLNQLRERDKLILDVSVRSNNYKYPDSVVVHTATDLGVDRLYALSMVFYSGATECTLRVIPRSGPDSEGMYWSERDTVMRGAGFNEQLFSPTYELDGMLIDCEFSRSIRYGTF